MEDTIYAYFQKIVSEHPNAPAIIERERTLSFAELSSLADRIARALPDGIRSVGIVMSHRAEMIAAMLAAAKRGARYVPAEPSFPKGRIRYMMTESAVSIILTEKEYEERLGGLPARLADCEICAFSPARAECESDCTASQGAAERGDNGAAFQEAAERGEARPDDPAYVLYTSGTTGNPKGVCVTNKNVCHYARAFAREFHPAPGDVMLQHSVCSFDIFVEEVFGSLLNGAALAIPPAEERDDIRALMSFVEEKGVTMISGFPYLLAEMNHLPSIPASLRLLISGGDVLRGIYVDRLIGRAEVYNTYGPSETTVCASYYRCNGGAVLEDGTYPIGKPVTGAAIRILDSDGREVPAGETGEICILGDGVSMGYIGSHDEENRAFETLSDGSVMYHSGDLGYMLSDGNIAFLHRKDTQIMIYGKRVEVLEVESRLYQCSGVEQALVRAYEDEEGLSYMIAYIVPANGSVKASDIRKELSEYLTDFMIPEFIVTMPKIPLNSNGKPDLSQLPVVLKAG